MNFKNQSLAIFNKGHFEPINDTSEEKAEAFMDKKMFLALSVVLIYQTIVKSSCHYAKW